MSKAGMWASDRRRYAELVELARFYGAKARRGWPLAGNNPMTGRDWAFGGTFVGHVHREAQRAGHVALARTYLRAARELRRAYL